MRPSIVGIIAAALSALTLHSSSTHADEPPADADEPPAPSRFSVDLGPMIGIPIGDVSDQANFTVGARLSPAFVLVGGLEAILSADVSVANKNDLSSDDDLTFYNFDAGVRYGVATRINVTFMLEALAGAHTSHLASSRNGSVDTAFGVRGGFGATVDIGRYIFITPQVAYLAAFQSNGTTSFVAFETRVGVRL